MPRCLRCGAEIKEGNYCSHCIVEILKKMAGKEFKDKGRQFEWKVYEFIEKILKELRIYDKLIILPNYDIKGFSGGNYKVDIAVLDRSQNVGVLIECATIGGKHPLQYFDKMARDYTKLSDILYYWRNKMPKLEALEVVDRPPYEQESPKVDYQKLFHIINARYVVFDENGRSNIREVFERLIPWVF